MDRWRAAATAFAGGVCCAAAAGGRSPTTAGAATLIVRETRPCQSKAFFTNNRTTKPSGPDGRGARGLCMAPGAGDAIRFLTHCPPGTSTSTSIQWRENLFG